MNCWGDNTEGALGDGTFDASVTPVPAKGIGGIGELTRVKQITAGNEHTCALKTNGQVNCWGDGDGGRLGDGFGGSNNTPVVVTAVDGNGALTRVRQVVAGGLHTCALATNGRVTCWGGNDSGQLGAGDDVFEAPIPVEVKAIGGKGVLTAVKQLGAGTNHTCALKTNGQVNCRGGNGSGQLGNGTMASKTVPTRQWRSRRSAAAACLAQPRESLPVPIIRVRC